MAAKAQTTKAGFLRPSTLAGIPLGDHDGLPITTSSGSITGLDGGFSETAALDKIHIPVKSRVVGLIVMEAVSHEYDRVTEGRGAKATVLEEFVENTVFKGESVLLIDPDDVEEVVAKHEKRIAEAREAAEKAAKEAKGEFSLPFPDTGDGKPPADDGAAAVEPAAGKTVPASKVTGAGKAAADKAKGNLGSVK